MQLAGAIHLRLLDLRHINQNLHLVVLVVCQRSKALLGHFVRPDDLGYHSSRLQVAAMHGLDDLFEVAINVRCDCDDVNRESEI
jgi:hypothetical protein